MELGVHSVGDTIVHQDLRQKHPGGGQVRHGMGTCVMAKHTAGKQLSLGDLKSRGLDLDLCIWITEMCK